ncbi:hypothetical protein [Aquisediminimonas profunda]|uniref:hypothetical protein n=1 Tax=Aquisediminimonas profunda TaxID=1550733 RepID=UPI001C6323CF|nr:hypothetical protein [Aquisediminimonas profunda]
MSETEKPNRPSHIAYQVRDGAEGASHFNRIGSAFAHKDGQGYNVRLDSVPVDGRITLRTVKERIAEAREERNNPSPRGRGEIER